MENQSKNRPFGFKSGKYLLAGVTLIILIMTTQVANAQKRWDAELRSGANLPTAKLGNASLDTGFGFEGSLAYRFLPNLAAYAGWSWNKFSANESMLGSNVDFEETGCLFGLQFIHPLAASKQKIRTEQSLMIPVMA